MIRAPAALAALALMLLAGPALADTIKSMDGTYQKVGSAGASVDVQNLSSNVVQLLTAGTQPAATIQGQVLRGGEHRCWPLTVDLYALGAAPGQVAVTTGMTCGGGSGGGSSSPPASVSFGQAKIATTGTPVPLPSITGVNGFVVRIKSENTGVNGYDVAGPSGVTTACDGTGNGACEKPGGAWSFGVSSAGAVYVNGAAGDIFYVYGN